MTGRADSPVLRVEDVEVGKEVEGIKEFRELFAVAGGLGSRTLAASATEVLVHASPKMSKVAKMSD